MRTAAFDIPPPHLILNSLIDAGDIVMVRRVPTLIVPLGKRLADALAAFGADAAEAELDDEDGCGVEDMPLPVDGRPGDADDAESDDEDACDAEDVPLPSDGRPGDPDDAESDERFPDV